MTAALDLPARSSKRADRWGPWLWEPRLDLAAFGGSALLALLLVALGHWLGWSDAPLSPVGFLVLILAVDVAHVYATLFRTYLDGHELRRRRLRYIAVPALAYVSGVVLHLHGAMTFWRVLAYVALFHFVRQQVGWVAVYRVRSGHDNTALDAWLDAGAVYAATLYPVAYWHVHLEETRFAWFLQGDFVPLNALAAWLPWLQALWMAMLVAFAVRQIWNLVVTGTLQLGKSLVVLTTALCWYVGIVATNSDFDFTVTNVLIHGIPYGVLLWKYAQQRELEGTPSVGSTVLRGGLAAFLGALLLLAFLEELAWDRLVWHDKPDLFGHRFVELGELALAIIVPLLALPQLTHYILDGLIWRRADSRANPAQKRAFGMLKGRT